MNYKLALLTAFLLCIFSIEILPQSKLVFELGTGLPYNFPVPLTIRQNGESTIHLTAQYESRPFEIPIFWDWRIGYWSGSDGWELEAIHHKLFLENKPPQVEQFDISHGLNLVIINRCFLRNGFIFKVGGGIALTHPESLIRRQRLIEARGILDQGYYVSGPALLFSAGKRLYLLNNNFIIVEAKLGLSYSYVPIANGTADVYNIAAMLTCCIGTDFFSLN